MFFFVLRAPPKLGVIRAAFALRIGTASVGFAAPRPQDFEYLPSGYGVRLIIQRHLPPRLGVAVKVYFLPQVLRGFHLVRYTEVDSKFFQGVRGEVSYPPCHDKGADRSSGLDGFEVMMNEPCVSSPNVELRIMGDNYVRLGHNFIKFPC